MAEGEYDSLKKSHPTNSRKSREIKAVELRGELTEKQLPLGKRIARSFTGDDAQSVGSYVLFNVIIPMAKDMLFSAFSEGMSRVLFGSSPRSSTKSNGYTPYNKVQQRDEPRSLSSRERSTHDYSNVVLTSREDAVDILQNLRNTLDEYGVVMVPDLYAMINVNPKFVDEKFGWTNLSTAQIRHVANGWYLDLPKPVEIE